MGVSVTIYCHCIGGKKDPNEVSGHWLTVHNIFLSFFLKTVHFKRVNLFLIQLIHYGLLVFFCKISMWPIWQLKVTLLYTTDSYWLRRVVLHARNERGTRSGGKVVNLPFMLLTNVLKSTHTHLSQRALLQISRHPNSLQNWGFTQKLVFPVAEPNETPAWTRVIKFVCWRLAVNLLESWLTRMIFGPSHGVVGARPSRTRRTRPWNSETAARLQQPVIPRRGSLSPKTYKHSWTKTPKENAISTTRWGEL